MPRKNARPAAKAELAKRRKKAAERQSKAKPGQGVVLNGSSTSLVGVILASRLLDDWGGRS